jgi:hypothetical protein
VILTAPVCDLNHLLAGDARQPSALARVNQFPLIVAIINLNWTRLVCGTYRLETEETARRGFGAIFWGIRAGILRALGFSLVRKSGSPGSQPMYALDNTSLAAAETLRFAEPDNV